jgi:hypothetical protein
MAGHDAGVEVTCPGCGQVVLQKAMIPLRTDDPAAVRYLCAPCARLLVATNAPPNDGAAEPSAQHGSDALAAPESVAPSE